MTAAAATRPPARPEADDPHLLRGGHPPRRGDHGGVAPKAIVVGYGFWLFIVSDIILFSGFFAAYAVLSGATADGPAGRDIFELGTVGVETACLLLSTFLCGLATVASERRSMLWTQLCLFGTGLLGFVFVCLELNEFVGLIARGYGPERSAFLSSFFALVGCHGLHVSIAILWCGTTMAQFWAKGFRDDIARRMMCFSLFWHALDIVWIGVFTIVYLMGARG